MGHGSVSGMRAHRRCRAAGALMPGDIPQPWQYQPGGTLPDHCVQHPGWHLVWCNRCIKAEREWWARRVACYCRTCQTELARATSDVVDRLVAERESSDVPKSKPGG